MGDMLPCDSTRAVSVAAMSRLAYDPSPSADPSPSPQFSGLLRCHQSLRGFSAPIQRVKLPVLVGVGVIGGEHRTMTSDAQS